MNKDNSLKFDVNTLFNCTFLQTYDEDGQKGFLGYLIRSQSWCIRDNQIVFPAIKTEKMVETLMHSYNDDVLRTNIMIKKDAIDKIRVFGILGYNNMLNEDLEKLNKRQNVIHINNVGYQKVDRRQAELRCQR